MHLKPLVASRTSRRLYMVASVLYLVVVVQASSTTAVEIEVGNRHSCARMGDNSLNKSGIQHSR